MATLFLANLLGLALDHRVITGDPAWRKPAKFSFSVAVYTGTLAWILSLLTVWPVFVRWMAYLIAGAMFVDIFIIDLQAWRGTTSHFNFRTDLDTSLFAIMGLCIAIFWLASVGIAVALFRQNFWGQSFGWALRLGMLITVFGSLSGSIVTHGQPGQKIPGILGAHTVGAPDGGAGLAGTGWSPSHGDLRIPHFAGLHGVQVMPLLYWLLARRRNPRVSTIVIAAVGYLMLVLLLLWQALRGQALL